MQEYGELFGDLGLSEADLSVLSPRFREERQRQQRRQPDIQPKHEKPQSEFTWMFNFANAGVWLAIGTVSTHIARMNEWARPTYWVLLPATFIVVTGMGVFGHKKNLLRAFALVIGVIAGSYDWMLLAFSGEEGLMMKLGLTGLVLVGLAMVSSGLNGGRRHDDRIRRPIR